LLQTTNFGSKHWFAAVNTLSTANTSSLHTTQFRQWTLIRCRHHNFGSDSYFAVDNRTFDSERWFTTDNTLLAANTSSLLTTNFGSESYFAVDNRPRQRMLIRYRQHTFSSEHKFAANNALSTANADSLRTTQFATANTSSLWTTQVHLSRFSEFIHFMFSLTLW
jgi:uncharacterized membrane-anchored protein